MSGFNAKSVANDIILKHYEATGNDVLDIPLSAIPEAVHEHFQEKTELEYYSVLTVLIQLKDAAHYRKNHSVESHIQ